MLLALLGRVGLFGCFQTSGDLGLQQRGILQQADHFFPNEVIQIVLARWRTGADGMLELPPSVRTNTAVVVELAFARTRRIPVETIATLRTDQHALQQTGFNGAPPGELFVGFQPFLGQREGLLPNEGGNTDLDPFLPWPFLVSATALGIPSALP